MAVDPGLSLDCRSGRSGRPAAARELTRSGGEGYLRRIMPVPINYKLLHGQAVPPFCCADAAVAELAKIGFVLLLYMTTSYVERVGLIES